jgi:hypothetical protein
MPKSKKRMAQLPVLHLDAAGVDIGADEIFVAVPADRDPKPVRSLSTFTRDLNDLVDWLQGCGIRTVAMESTSVYWIPLYQVLEERGLDVCLVNAQYVRNVPGRKTDVSDCQWIQYLHTVGLLRASFRPAAEICAIRSLWRHRGSLIQMAAEHVLHIQKALDQMNLQIHRVLSDITGQSGQRILDAIVAGQRDPVLLLVYVIPESGAARTQSRRHSREIIGTNTCLHSGNHWQAIVTTKNSLPKLIRRWNATLQVCAQVPGLIRSCQRRQRRPSTDDSTMNLRLISGVNSIESLVSISRMYLGSALLPPTRSYVRLAQI